MPSSLDARRVPLRYRASRLKHWFYSAYACGIRAVGLRVYLNRHRDLVEVPLEMCTNPLAFSYGSGGWHYLTGTLNEYLRSPDITWDRSLLSKFHARYVLRDSSDLVSYTSGVSYVCPFGLLPWGGFGSGQDQPKNIGRSRQCGPSDSSLIRWEFHQAIYVFERLRRQGYRPWWHESGFIAGVFLERQNGERRFVVTDGTHRCAALSVLGYDKVVMRYEPGRSTAIREKDVDRWPAVREGLCSRSDARAYFNAYFELDGRERARRLGLVPDEKDVDVNADGVGATHR